MLRGTALYLQGCQIQKRRVLGPAQVPAGPLGQDLYPVLEGVAVDEQLLRAPPYISPLLKVEKNQPGEVPLFLVRAAGEEDLPQILAELSRDALNQKLQRHLVVELQSAPV